MQQLNITYDVKESRNFIRARATALILSIMFGLLIVASLLFSFYTANFANYNATYGSIGAMIILMLWLYIAGLVILAGSEVNALVEHYSSNGKVKGEKKETEEAGGALPNLK
jgi:membrane protein